MARRYRLGKLHARHAFKLKLRDYLDVSLLPTPPEEFGHEQLITDWGMLGNQNYGDCVLAGAAHETMLWNAVAGHPVAFSDQVVLDVYSKLTGFTPNDPRTDRGTDVLEAAHFRKDIGMLDNAGNLHKVAAALELTPCDFGDLWHALYLFGAVGTGFLLPAQAQQEFDSNQPWIVTSDDRIEGGHYVPAVARRNGMLVVVTWGRLQTVTPEFYSRYSDEAVAYISEDFLTNGKSPEGFDIDQLQRDLEILSRT